MTRQEFTAYRLSELGFDPSALSLCMAIGMQPEDILQEVNCYLNNGLTSEGYARETFFEAHESDFTALSEKKEETAHSLMDIFSRIKPENADRFSRDDRGTARLFANCFSDQLFYNVTAREWFFFDGKKWQPDQGGMYAARRSKEFIESLLIYSINLPDGPDAKAYRKFITKYGDFSKRKTLVEDARSEMFLSNEDLDKNGSLFNVQNGVFNLDTFELLPHRPDYYLTKISNVVFDPYAESTLFKKFLSEVLEGDTEKVSYLQKWAGLSATEDTSREEMLILLGVRTRNGKSTYLETLSYVFGGANGYALNMPPETLAQRKNKDTRTASGDIARLDGCRLLITSEPPKRMLFDAALLKTLLGRDTITARQLYQSEFQFQPRFKLLMNTNYLPIIQDESLFTSGRIKVLEFNRHFTPAEQDLTLKSRLRSPENVSGIFNWCMEGLRLYRETGLEPPTVVVQAVESYRQASDKLQSFLSDCMERTGKNTAAGAAYQAYRTWCLDNGYGIESKGNFFAELKSRGLFAPLGTVNGLSVKNVLTGYELTEN